MNYQQKTLLEKIMRDTSPMEVLETMGGLIKKESEFSRTGMEEFGLKKIAIVLNQTSDVVLKVIENLRDYQPKHRMYNNVHYSPRHAKEIFKS